MKKKKKKTKKVQIHLEPIGSLRMRKSMELVLKQSCGFVTERNKEKDDSSERKKEVESEICRGIIHDLQPRNGGTEKL